MSPLKNVSTSAGIECVLSTQKLHNYSFLQQIISCTETRQKIMPSDRSQCPEQIPAGPNFQNGNSRNNQKFSYKREWLVSIDLTDVHFHIPMHKESQHLLHFHVHGQTYQYQVLPFQSVTALLEFT